MITRLLSYFIPIPLKKVPSKVSDNLEINWNNGKLVLDTKNTNYSYGNLQKTLERGLQYIGRRKIVKMNHVLVLGLGAGSIIDSLRNNLGYCQAITSVELDPVVIDLARKYFNLDQYTDQHTIVEADAFEFILKCQNTFDLIVIDVFQDANMPNFLFESYFVEHLQRVLRSKGFILFNTILLEKEHQLRNENYLKLYKASEYTTRKLSSREHFNEMLILKKI